jgi:DMSO/TMAO reductase YedYZ molybdopterin-dependent catalytic subunit
VSPRRPIFSRRELLLGAGALLAGCSASEPREGVLGAADRFTDRAQALLFRPAHLAPRPGDQAVTRQTEFPQYKVGEDFPSVPAGWLLEIGGMVARPMRLSLVDLQKLERTEMRVRHHCVEGWSAVASWHGLTLARLAELVGADPRAGFVEFDSFEPVPGGGAEGEEEEDEGPPARMAVDAKEKGLEGESRKPAMKTYRSSWDRPSALHPQTMLAYGMNGAPLGIEHGGPVRLYGSTKLGYKMVKWLSAVRFMPAATGGYWEDQGYEWFAGV